MRAVEEFRHTIERAGLMPPSVIPLGKVTRFPGVGKSNGNKSGWVWLSEDGQGGAFGDWASGLSDTWHAQHDHAMTAAERAAHTRRVAELRRIREEEEANQHAEAAKRAQTIWNQAAPAPEAHPYLTRKRIQPHDLRVDDENRLIVPVLIANTLASLQFINTEGAKQFLPGGKVKGGAFTFGEVTKGSPILLCEGFATAASLYEATALPVAVAFSAGNLTPVAEPLRQQCPTATIILCGDHDLSGIGQREARKAADAVSGVVVLPEVPGQDWNDVQTQRGLDAVKEAITAVIRREKTMTESRHILDEVYAFLGRFVAYPSEHARVAHCLWVAHTHLMEEWESTPRLAFLSPEPGSGKTRAMELTETLVPRPVEAINVTSAYLFRKISDPDGLPTVLHDEIDTIFGARAKEHEEIRGVINAGHRRGAAAGRCVVKGKTIETEELPAFCAVAMAGLGHLPDTILTRSVIIKMRRRAPGEDVESYRRRVHASEGYQLRDRLAAWAVQIRPTLNTYPIMPDGITDRNADVWESLLSVADATGELWPDRARVAAVALVADAKGGQHSLGVRLLGDLRVVFGDRDSLLTVEILLALMDLEEAPWGDLNGKPLDARRLANLLKPYGVTSKQVRRGESNQRGYTYGDLQDAWARYLPTKADEPGGVGQSPRAAATSATNATSKTPGEESLYANDQTEVINLVN
jgi:phage/plasmid primase-like uncharacterized protein